MFLVVPFAKICLFSKDLITFIIYFISFFVRVIPELVTDGIPFLISLVIILSPVSTKISSFNFLVSEFFYSFSNELFIEFANDIIPSICGKGGTNTLQSFS